MISVHPFLCVALNASFVSPEYDTGPGRGQGGKPTESGAMPDAAILSASEPSPKLGNHFFPAHLRQRDCVLSNCSWLAPHTPRFVAYIFAFLSASAGASECCWFTSEAPFPASTIAPPPYPSRPTGLPEFNRIVSEVSQICKTTQQVEWARDKVAFCGGTCCTTVEWVAGGVDNMHTLQPLSCAWSDTPICRFVLMRLGG